MAEHSGFFPDVDGDRLYTTDFLAQWIASFIGNGVYNGDLVVSEGSHMQVIIPPGQAWINGFYYNNDSNLILPVANADGVLSRKDTVVLRWDINERNVTAQILTGTFSSSPIAPTIVRNAEQYDLKLAEISIAAGTTSITQAMIMDTRLNKSVCGIVTGFIEQADTTAIFNQFQSWFNQKSAEYEDDLSTSLKNFTDEFTTWFSDIQDILDENTAGNLLNLINDLAAEVETKETPAGAQAKVDVVADALAAHEADKVQHIGYATASGTNTYTASITGITSLSEGLSIKVKFTNANTGASMLNINSLGAKAIQKGNGNALSSGNIKAGQICHLVYTGSVFQLLGEGGEYGTAGPTQVLQGYTIGTETGIQNGQIPVKNPDLADSVLAVSKMAFNDWGDGKNYALMNGITNAYFGSNVGWIRTEEPDLVASNILAGKNIFGLTGTAIDGAGMKKFASGNVSVAGGTYGTVVISGLDFIPAFIAVCKNGGDEISFYNSGILNQRLREYYNPETNAIFNISAGTFSFSAYNEYTSQYHWFATN
ncbi:MAG TPA: hypothetical protein GX523_07685 [Desulfitobacterium dehalogenans]|uniref:Uncharacterized protein n=1 Tax=Desulfitobacterium dehalogenans TaxID=36854 RepID=A0A7C7D5B4_9FIRM|nr:hypothetical protein [Desulfitobacterium dehalogenans]